MQALVRMANVTKTAALMQPFAHRWRLAVHARNGRSGVPPWSTPRACAAESWTWRVEPRQTTQNRSASDILAGPFQALSVNMRGQGIAMRLPGSAPEVAARLLVVAGLAPCGLCANASDTESNRLTPRPAGEGSISGHAQSVSPGHICDAAVACQLGSCDPGRLQYAASWRMDRRHAHGACVSDTATSIPTRSQFVLQEVQPALLGLMDGSVSTLAPIFATAGLTGRPLSAFRRARCIARRRMSMGLSEALSDDGTVTGRGGPVRRGTITGIATAIGGMLHTLPFLIPDLAIALKLAYVVVACELLAIAFIGYRFMGGALADTIVQVVIGGALVFAIGVWLGRVGAG